MFCMKCGMELQESDKFCRKCGTRFDFHLISNEVTSKNNLNNGYQFESSQMNRKLDTYYAGNTPVSNAGTIPGVNHSYAIVRRKIIIAIGIVSALLIAVVLLFNSRIKITKMGNTAGNLNNVGWAVQQGDWIYYCNGSNKEKLYKMNKDGTNKIQVSEIEEAREINVQGDWIYYIKWFGDQKIYKIKTDGTSNTKISNAGAFEDIVAGDWIYYNSFSDKKLYKMKTDGTNNIKLGDDAIAFINIVGDWIYCSNLTDNGKIYKIKKDGTSKTQIGDDKAWYIDIEDDWIYYMNGSDGNKLYKIKIDGTNKIKISDDVVNPSKDNMGGINIDGDWIYYNTSGKLYKIKTNGTQRTKLSDDNAFFINLIGDWIYYENYMQGNEGGGNYRIKSDGTGRQLVQ